MVPDSYYRMMNRLFAEIRESFAITHGAQVDLTAADALRQWLAARGIRASWTAIILKAIALVLRDRSPMHPEFQSYLPAFALRPRRFDKIVAGVACQRDLGGFQGVTQGTVPDPEKKSLAEIAQELSRLRTGELREDIPWLLRLPGFLQRLVLWSGVNVRRFRQIYRGTFHLTTVGKYGVDWQIQLPAASPLTFGFGLVKRRPVAVGDRVEPRLTVNLTMCFDRRFIDGGPAAELLAEIARRLERAELEERSEESIGASAVGFLGGVAGIVENAAPSRQEETANLAVLEKVKALDRAPAAAKEVSG